MRERVGKEATHTLPGTLAFNSFSPISLTYTLSLLSLSLSHTHTHINHLEVVGRVPGAQVRGDGVGDQALLELRVAELGPDGRLVDLGVILQGGGLFLNLHPPHLGREWVCLWVEARGGG